MCLRVWGTVRGLKARVWVSGSGAPWFEFQGLGLRVWGIRACLRPGAQGPLASGPACAYLCVTAYGAVEPVVLAGHGGTQLVAFPQGCMHQPHAAAQGGRGLTQGAGQQ